jgi:hypothetical protein
MTTFFVLHALIGFCGTMPSVEFFKWVRELHIVLKERDPMNSPYASGNGTPEPDIYWRSFAGLLGGVLGAVIVKDTLTDPVYTVASAYAFGRFLSEGVSILRFQVPSFKRPTSVK